MLEQLERRYTDFLQQLTAPDITFNEDEFQANYGYLDENTQRLLRRDMMPTLPFQGDPAEAFDRNWRVFEANEQTGEICSEVLRFRTIMRAALERGQKRDAEVHHVMVHLDWIKNDETQSDIAKGYLDALRERIHKIDNPIFLVSNKAAHKSVDLSEFKFSQERTVETWAPYSNTNELSGFFDIEGLQKFLQITQGYHPKDSFIIHGGEWGACMTHCALQLTAMTLGKWWPKLLTRQADIIANVSPLNNLPVQFGLALDFENASFQFAMGLDRVRGLKAGLQFNKPKKTEIFNGHSLTTVS